MCIVYAERGNRDDTDDRVALKFRQRYHFFRDDQRCSEIASMELVGPLSEQRTNQQLSLICRRDSATALFIIDASSAPP